MITLRAEITSRKRDQCWTLSSRKGFGYHPSDGVLQLKTIIKWYHNQEPLWYQKPFEWNKHYPRCLFVSIPKTSHPLVYYSVTLKLCYTSAVCAPNSRARRVHNTTLCKLQTHTRAVCTNTLRKLAHQRNHSVVYTVTPDRLQAQYKYTQSTQQHYTTWEERLSDGTKWKERRVVRCDKVKNSGHSFPPFQKWSR